MGSVLVPFVKLAFKLALVVEHAVGLVSVFLTELKTEFVVKQCFLVL